MAMSTSSLMLAALRVRDWMLSILSAIVLLLIVFWTSAFLYGSFYFAYMPRGLSLTFPAHFTFDVCKEDLVSRCSFPKASVDFRRGQAATFLPGQKYTVSLELEMPRTKKNLDAGMFMVCLNMRREENGHSVEKKAEQCRAGMLRHKTAVFDLIESLFLAPFQLMSAATESDAGIEVVDVQFDDEFVDDTYRPVSGAVLEMRHAGVDFAHAALRVHAHFSGLRALMFHHPVAASFLGVGSISTLVFSTLYFFWKSMFEPKSAVNMSRNSSVLLQERQERAREALNRSSSQQRVVRKVSENLLAQQQQQQQLQQQVKSGEDDTELLRMRIDEIDTTREKQE